MLEVSVKMGTFIEKCEIFSVFCGKVGGFLSDRRKFWVFSLKNV